MRHISTQFCTKRKWSADIGDNTDESWKCYAKMPATESPYMTGFYLYEMFKIGKSIETQNRLVASLSRTGTDCACASSQCDENVLELNSWWLRNSEYTKTQWTCILKGRNLWFVN